MTHIQELTCTVKKFLLTFLILYVVVYRASLFLIKNNTVIMPIDMGFAFNSVKNTFTQYLGRTFKSTFWTAVLITSIIVIVIMFIYPTKSGEPFYILFRPIMYIFISTLIVMFIHDSCVYDDIKKKNDELESEEIVGGMESYRNSKVVTGRKRDTNIYKILFPGEGDDIDVESRPHEQIGPQAAVRVRGGDDVSAAVVADAAAADSSSVVAESSTAAAESSTAAAESAAADSTAEGKIVDTKI